MPIDVPAPDRIPMRQRERDTLKIMAPVLQGERTQAEAARLLGLSVRQVRRLQRKLERDGDTALVHGLRGKPSNRRLKPQLRQQVLAAYHERFADFGPTFACEKLAEQGLVVSPDTLRRWLIAEGLWQRRRRRAPHRSRRPRRACFGEQPASEGIGRHLQTAFGEFLGGERRAKVGIVLAVELQDTAAELGSFAVVGRVATQTVDEGGIATVLQALQESADVSGGEA